MFAIVGEKEAPILSFHLLEDVTGKTDVLAIYINM